jgi:hypothetical protein
MPIRRFFTHGLLFATPFFIWLLIIVVVDPFDYFDLFHGIPAHVKRENAAALNTLMFNMLKEVHNPAENLIIGDSRVESLSLEQIEDITGKRYQRLASNALKLNEAVDLFWFANRRKRVSHVLFGINFNQYNEYAFADRVHSVEAVIHNPFLYVFDRSVAQAVYYVIKASVTHRNAVNSVPPMTRDEFWNYIVEVRAREHYGRYRHPDALYKRMQEMVKFAKGQGTEVTFLIVPHHADFQRRVSDFGLMNDFMRFKHDMSDLGVRVIDYDYANEITSQRSNFRDPLHCSDAVTQMIVGEVFGGRLALGKLVNASSVTKDSQPHF